MLGPSIGNSDILDPTANWGLKRGKPPLDLVDVFRNRLIDMLD